MTENTVIAGFGSELSAALANRLLQRGHHVAGISRTGRSGASFAQTHANFTSHVADTGDRAAIARVVSDIERTHGSPSMLVYNAAELLVGDFFDITSDDFERVWRTTCLGAMQAAQLVLPSMLDAGRGTLIFTGATASVKGGAKFTAFASAKFALRGLAQSLARAFGPRGIHVAHVVIDGVIWGERVEKTFGMSRQACIEPEDVVDAYVALLEQKHSAWTHELDLRPAAERF